MKIGDYSLYSVQTGLFRLDGGAMFGVVPKPLWSKTNPADGLNRIDMCMRALLLVSGKKKILVDNGVGYKMSSKLNEIYGVDHSKFTLEGSLKELGYTAGDITDVILTHLHFDHAGGSTYRQDGKIKPAFPNATHYLQKKHWEWALNPSDRDKASFFPDNYVPLNEAGQLKLLDGGCRFDEAITLHVVNGHTPAQQLVTVSDGDNTLLFTADLFPLASHVHIPYIMSYDLYPLTTLDEKKTFLKNITGGNWTLFFEHDPFTETCGVELKEGRFITKDIKELKER